MALDTCMSPGRVVIRFLRSAYSPIRDTDLVRIGVGDAPHQVTPSVRSPDRTASMKALGGLVRVLVDAVDDEDWRSKVRAIRAAEPDLAVSARDVGCVVKPDVGAQQPSGPGFGFAELAVVVAAHEAHWFTRKLREAIPHVCRARPRREGLAGLRSAGVVVVAGEVGDERHVAIIATTDAGPSV